MSKLREGLRYQSFNFDNSQDVIKCVRIHNGDVEDERCEDKKDIKIEKDGIDEEHNEKDGVKKQENDKWLNDKNDKVIMIKRMTTTTKNLMIISMTG
jgi:hypothetical protein